MDLKIKNEFERFGVLLDFKNKTLIQGYRGNEFEEYFFHCVRSNCNLIVSVAKSGSGAVLIIEKMGKHVFQSFNIPKDKSFEESLRVFLSGDEFILEMLNGFREVENFFDWRGLK